MCMCTLEIEYFVLLIYPVKNKTLEVLGCRGFQNLSAALQCGIEYCFGKKLCWEDAYDWKNRHISSHFQ